MSAIDDFYKETSGKTYTIVELASLVRETLVRFGAEIIDGVIAGIDSDWRLSTRRQLIAAGLVRRPRSERKRIRRTKAEQRRAT